MPIKLKRCSGPCGEHKPITVFWNDAGAPDGKMSRCPTCEKNARTERAAARAAGDTEGAVVDRTGRVVVYSEAERQRRSELAKRLHAEGRFGGAVIGARGGQAITRHRITDAVLDHFRQPDEQKLVIDAYRSALKAKDKRLRMTAADKLLDREAKQDERLARDRGGAVDPAAMTHEELEEFVAQGLQAMIERGEIPADVVVNEDDVIDVGPKFESVE